MKTTIFIFAVLFAFCSCTKKAHCYQCTSIWNNGITKPTIDYTSHCGWTEDQKQNYEHSNTKTWYNGGHLATSRMTCHID